MFQSAFAAKNTSKAEVIRQSLFKEGTGYEKFLKPLLT